MSRIEAIYKEGVRQFKLYNAKDYHIPKHTRTYKRINNSHASDARKNGSDPGGISQYHAEDYAGAGSCTAKIFYDGFVN
jgi:hypothetical protein